MVAEHHELRGLEDGPSFRKAIALSLALHLVLFGTAFLVMSSRTKRLHYAPAYTVSLAGPEALRGGKPSSGTKVIERETPRTQTKEVKRAKHPRARPRPKPKPKEIPLKRAAPAETEERVAPKAPPREADKVAETGSKVAAALERIRKKVAKEEELEEAASAGTASGRGSGRSPGGGSAGLTELPFREYYNLIWRRVRDAWVLPENIGEGERRRLVAVVEFQVTSTGEISNVRLESSSGNTYFDNSALRAVKKANPLPPFPPELSRPYLMVGVRFHNPL